MIYPKFPDQKHMTNEEHYMPDVKAGDRVYRGQYLGIDPASITAANPKGFARPFQPKDIRVGGLASRNICADKGVTEMGKVTTNISVFVLVENGGTPITDLDIGRPVKCTGPLITVPGAPINLPTVSTYELEAAGAPSGDTVGTFEGVAEDPARGGVEGTGTWGWLHIHTRDELASL